MAEQAIEKHWDSWIANNDADGLIMLEHDSSARRVTFLLVDDEFTIQYPPDYPNSESRLKLQTKSKKLANVVDKVNRELLQKSPSACTIGDVLSSLVALKNKYQKIEEEESDNGEENENAEEDYEVDDIEDNAEDEAEAEDEAADAMDEDFETYGEGYEDGLELKDEELELLKMKKRWRMKEQEIRASLKSQKDKKIGSKQVENIFTGHAATGVLTNDLIAIMQNSSKLGFTAQPIDDNIYEWEVKLFGFSPDCQIAKDLVEVQKNFGYDYVELRISFKMDLYPFYPPLVKLVRPRFKGFMMGRITSMEMLKLDNWDPVKDMRETIGQIRLLLETYGQIDITNVMNDSVRYPAGAYTELEYLLLELELLCDKDPRANLKYPPPEWKKREKAATRAKKQNSSTQEYWAKGTGYGYDSAPNASWNVNAYLAAQKERDMEIERVLNKIRVEIEATEGLNPQFIASTYLVLEESCLIPVLEQYLANDSFLDMSRHASLYTTIFALSRSIARHKNFVGLLDKLEHQRVSIFELFEALHKQASVYLKTLKTAADPSISQQDVVVQDCEETYVVVNSAVDAWRKKHGTSTASVSATSGLTDNEETDKYIRIMKPLQFDHLDMTNYPHYYGQHKASPSREKVMRLAQETSSLANSLPLSTQSSVFVRIDENQIDKMTAMITGPLETPYAGGCFLFDIYFPPQYPSVPPQVNLQTTGNGSVRFNPNLYNSGKVCLSLLGTWSGAEGETWNKDTSTLLQVLVSIQSLILVPQPYFNEPGFERTMHTPEGKKQSRLYNENIREATIRWAMIDQLQHPKLGYEEVIKAHFYLMKDTIVKIIKGWIDEPEASQGHVARLKNLLRELQKELDALPPPQE